MHSDMHWLWAIIGFIAVRVCWCCFTGGDWSDQMFGSASYWNNKRQRQDAGIAFMAWIIPIVLVLGGLFVLALSVKTEPVHTDAFVDADTLKEAQARRAKANANVPQHAVTSAAKPVVKPVTNKSHAGNATKHVATSNHKAATKHNGSHKQHAN